MPSNYWRDKVVLVTGGSSGLGRVIAEQFALRGARLAVAGLEADRVESAEKELRQAGHQAIGIVADVTRQDDVDSLLEKTLARFGQIDVLVNNAGRSMRGQILDITPEQFREMMELNFLSVVRCTRAAVPHLLPRRGHVINMGSLAAKAATRWVGAYPASKFAVAAYSQQLRLELGPQGLHVLLVCPGPIRRKGPRLYPLEGGRELPETARQPGAGVKLDAAHPERLVWAMLRAAEHRKPELVYPRKARVLFALSQIWPALGDWLILRNTGD